MELLELLLIVVFSVCSFFAASPVHHEFSIDPTGKARSEGPPLEHAIFVDKVRTGRPESVRAFSVLCPLSRIYDYAGCTIS